MTSNSMLSNIVLVGSLALSVPELQSCRTNQSAASQISDSAITPSVKTKMIGDDDVKAHNIDVNTEEGVVYLMGRVATAAEKAEAERIARSCDGVIDVVNDLEVAETG